MASDDYAAHLRSLVVDPAWAVEVDERGAWCTVQRRDAPPLPAQGWKLHLSATNVTAIDLLDRAVPYLVEHGLTFKAAVDSMMLHLLNRGDGGPDQIGKFVTIYPGGTTAAVQAAAELDHLLAGLHGPVVPSDRRLRDDSVLSYRYGGFVGRWIQLPTGQLVPALERPDGTLVPDRRSAQDAVPEWLDDPFDAAGLVVAPTPRPEMLADRYRVLATLSRNPRGSVDLALDLPGRRRCVLKRAIVDDDPLGPSARLDAERRAFERVGGSPGIVEVYGWHEIGDEHVLVLEDLPGRDLDAELRARRPVGSVLDVAWTVDTVVAVAEVVAEMHRRGFVHRDLKPTNVVVRPSGEVVLVDFEFAAPIGTVAVAIGTPGYASPEQRRGEPTDVRDDVHGLGAILYLACTGVEPASRPPGFAAVAAIHDIAPDVPPALAAVVQRCLAPRAERFATVADLVAALRAARGERPAPVPSYGAVPLPPVDATTRAEEHLAGFVAALRADAVHDRFGGEDVSAWPIRHPSGPPFPPRDVANGVAGIVLTLTSIAGGLPAPDLHALVHAGARWLDAAPRPEGPLLGGLYVGEGGVALALARAGLLIDDPALVASALRRGADVAALAHVAPDLFNGSAGRALVHLRLAQETGDERSRDAALDAARHLVGTVTTTETGAHLWELPVEMGPPYVGYAHGAAGIADVLLEIGLVTGFEPAVELASAVGRDLARTAAHTDDGGVGWPVGYDGDGITTPAWCHGAGGIGRFLAHLDAARLLDAAHRPLVRACAIAVARQARPMPPIACHGLAGSIELLVDLHRADGDPAHLTEAWSLATLMAQFEQAGAGGTVRASSEQLEVVSPDLLFGYAGTAHAWLRLARPASTGLLDAGPA